MDFLSLIIIFLTFWSKFYIILPNSFIRLKQCFENLLVTTTPLTSAASTSDYFFATAYIEIYQIGFHRCSIYNWDPDALPASRLCPAGTGRIGGPTIACRFCCRRRGGGRHLHSQPQPNNMSQYWYSSRAEAKWRLLLTDLVAAIRSTSSSPTSSFICRSRAYPDHPCCGCLIYCKII